jgi:hypothetical protein
MVDLTEIQAAYYMVAATGVLVAAVFYVLNLREQRKNMKLTLETRRVALLDSITTRLIDEEMIRSGLQLLRYEWNDYGDFERKYGSENNLEAAAIRISMWSRYNSFGTMLRRGFITGDDLYDLGVQSQIIWIWEKFKRVIEENRRRYNGVDYLSDFEYLAGEMLKMMVKRDPSFRVPETLDKYVPDK